MAYNEYGLTHKQEKFANLVASGMTQADAYRHSYKADFMSAKTIHEKASCLMANDKVRARVDMIVNKAVKEAEEDTVVTIQELMKFHKDVKDFSIARIADVYMAEDGKPFVKLKENADMKFVKKLTFDYRGSAVIELWDKQKSAQALKEILDASEGNNVQEVRVIMEGVGEFGN